MKENNVHVYLQYVEISSKKMIGNSFFKSEFIKENPIPFPLFYQKLEGRLTKEIFT